MSLPSISGSSSGFDRLLLVDYLRVLYRRRWMAIPVILAVIVAVAVHNHRTVPMYQAQASVLIDVVEPNVVNFRQVFDEGSGYGNYPQTQHALLVSRALVQQTVRAMELWKRPGFGATTEEGAVAAVQGGLLVAPIRGTRMAQIRFLWHDPKMAAEIVNAHAKQYIEQSLAKRFQATSEATEWLDAQLAAERKRVEDSERALQTYREQHDALSLQDGQNIVVQKLAELNTAVTRAKTNRIEKETQYRELVDAQRDPSTLDAFPTILANPFIQQLKGELSGLQRDYAQLAETLGDLHPTLVEKRTALETIEKRLAAEVTRVSNSVQNAYEVALAEEKSLTAALEEQKREALALNRRGIEYAALEREAQSVRLVYQTLLQRAKETNVSRELRGTNVQIVDPAQIPGRPVYPRKTFNMVMALLTGTLVAVGLVFVVEMIDDRIRVPRDITGQLGEAFLGLVPETSAKEADRVALVPRDESTPSVEAFRALRTGVLTAVGLEPPRSILVASSASGEGKTYVATNLAVALAQAQRRVLLVDADMRRPSAHDRFGRPLTPGLSNVLTGTATLNESLQKLPVSGLSLLSAGDITFEAPELLGSATFGDLLDILHEHFEWVIIDSPPVLTVTDASIIARRTSGIVFVVGSGMTRARTARLATEELRHAGGTMLGAVLNRAEVERHPYYFAPYGSREYLHTISTARDDRPAPPLTV